MGAKTVLSIYNKYKESWIINVVYDDLLDWSNWFVKKRTIHGSSGQVVDGLISLEVLVMKMSLLIQLKLEIICKMHVMNPD